MPINYVHFTILHNYINLILAPFLILLLMYAPFLSSIALFDNEWEAGFPVLFLYHQIRNDETINKYIKSKPRAFIDTFILT